MVANYPDRYDIQGPTSVSLNSRTDETRTVDPIHYYPAYLIRILHKKDSYWIIENTSPWRGHNAMGQKKPSTSRRVPDKEIDQLTRAASRANTSVEANW